VLNFYRSFHFTRLDRESRPILKLVMHDSHGSKSDLVEIRLDKKNRTFMLKETLAMIGTYFDEGSSDV
jgi:hypothetical protein